MVSSDTVVGIVGAVILTGAMIAVFYYEADRDPAGAPGADWGEGNELFHFMFVEDQYEPLLTTDDGLGVGLNESYSVQWKPYTFHVIVTVSNFGHDLDDTPLKERSEFLIELVDENGVVVADETGNGETVELHYTAPRELAAPENRNVTVAANTETEAQDTVQQELDRIERLNLTVRVTHVNNNVIVEDPTGDVPTEQGYTVEVVADYWNPELRQ